SGRGVLGRPESLLPVTSPKAWSVALQKLPSNRLDFDDMEAELGGGLLEQFDLLAAVPVLIILHSFVDVILSVLQHPVHYARKLVGHPGDRLRRSEPSSQATVLGSSIAAAPEQCRPGHAQRRSRPIDHMQGAFAGLLVPSAAAIGTYTQAGSEVRRGDPPA